MQISDMLQQERYVLTLWKSIRTAEDQLVGQTYLDN